MQLKLKLPVCQSVTRIFSPLLLHHIRRAKQLNGSRLYSFWKLQDRNKPGRQIHVLMTHKNIYLEFATELNREAVFRHWHKITTECHYFLFRPLAWHLIKIHPCQPFGQICRKVPAGGFILSLGGKNNLCKCVAIVFCFCLFFPYSCPGIQRPGCGAGPACLGSQRGGGR